jgi:uncharacterized protein YjaZ
MRRGRIKCDIVSWGKPALGSTERSEQQSYMFGDASKGLPWCVGYHFGYEIVMPYLSNNPDMSFNELINIEPEVILANSRFNKLIGGDEI